MHFVFVKFYSWYKIFQLECWHPSPILLVGRVSGPQIKFPAVRSRPSWFLRPFDPWELCTHAPYCNTVDLIRLLRTSSVTDFHLGFFILFSLKGTQSRSFYGGFLIDLLFLFSVDLRFVCWYGNWIFIRLFFESNRDSDIYVCRDD